MRRRLLVRVVAPVFGLVEFLVEIWQPFLKSLVILIGRLEAHEIRKGLVEPQVVPPLHRGQIAKPLVCVFVEYQTDYPHFLLFLGELVSEYVAVVNGDTARVLHGPHCEISTEDQIMFFKGEFDLKISFVNF